MDIKLIELTKICTKCGKRKNWNKFTNSKLSRFGVNSVCKVCVNVYRKTYIIKYRKENPSKIKAYYEKYKKKAESYRKKYYQINKDKLKTSKKIYLKNNKEKIAIQGKIYRDKNKEKISIRRKKYRNNNKDKIKVNNKNWSLKNKEKKAEYYKKYYKENRDNGRIYHKEYVRKKRATNPEFRLNSIISRAIGRSLKNGKNGNHWETLVPYTINDLIKRLKRTLPKGYIWNDYISGKADLHIDHIIPIAVHNFKSYTDTDFQRCWALKNLQLLPAKENMSKHAKLTKHFQPSLLL